MEGTRSRTCYLGASESESLIPRKCCASNHSKMKLESNGDVTEGTLPDDQKQLDVSLQPSAIYNIKNSMQGITSNIFRKVNICNIIFIIVKSISFLRELSSYGMFAVLLNAVYIIHMLLFVLGNKKTWTLLSIIMRITFDVFIYLVLAGATILIAIILNSYDICLKAKTEKAPIVPINAAALVCAPQIS